jgi:hypothetical protein
MPEEGDDVRDDKLAVDEVSKLFGRARAIADNDGRCRMFFWAATLDIRAVSTRTISRRRRQAARSTSELSETVSERVYVYMW